MAVVDLLSDRLKDQEAGSIQVKDARIEVRDDPSGEAGLVIVLVLSDPPPGAETWPVDDLWELRRIVRDVVAEVGLSPDNMPWSVAFESEDHGELEPEDTTEQLDADG
jgi:hypothetical protein